MKVIIAGGRDFTDYMKLASACDALLREVTVSEIVSGTAKGADQLGERFANGGGYPIKRFPADWDKHGKAAGPKRNAEMAEYADCLIAFWDGQSKGTKNMIDTAKKKGLWGLEAKTKIGRVGNAIDVKISKKLG